jgi:hypothetical protein
LGSGSADGRSTESGLLPTKIVIVQATKITWRVVEQNTMQSLKSGSRAINARIPNGSGEDGDVAQRLRT